MAADDRGNRSSDVEDANSERPNTQNNSDDKLSTSLGDFCDLKIKDNPIRARRKKSKRNTKKNSRANKRTSYVSSDQ